jgi:hypothetical protein
MGTLRCWSRDLLTDSTGKVGVERFESPAPTARAGYFLGQNGHIRAEVRSHADWPKEDFVRLAGQFVEMEMEAPPDLTAPPIQNCRLTRTVMFTGWTKSLR